MQAKRRFERREHELVEPQGAQQRVAAQRADGSRTPSQQAGLRSAQQLVAAECHHVDPGGDRLLDRRLGWLAQGAQVDDRAAAQVVHQQQAPLPRERRQFVQWRFLGEPNDAKVALMHLEQHARGGRDRAFVVR